MIGDGFGFVPIVSFLLCGSLRPPNDELSFLRKGGRVPGVGHTELVWLSSSASGTAPARLDGSPVLDKAPPILLLDSSCHPFSVLACQQVSIMIQLFGSFRLMVFGGQSYFS